MDSLLRYRRRFYIFHKVLILCSALQFLLGLDFVLTGTLIGIIFSLFSFFLTYYFFRQAMECYQDFKSIDNVIKETKRMGLS